MKFVEQNVAGNPVANGLLDAEPVPENLGHHP
jgi:hypothetical protein